MRYYEGTFYDINGEKYIVRIYDAEATGNSKLGDVQMGTDPFVISNETGDFDIMKPIIEQSAKMTLVQKYDEILDVTYNTRFHVEVINERDQDGLPMWSGYIVPGSNEQPWDGVKNDVEYNLVDDMTAMKYTNVNMSRTRTSIISYLYDHISTLQDTESRYLLIGNGVPCIGTNVSCFMAECGQAAWLDDSADGTQTSKSVFDVMEEFMRLIGCTMWSDGFNWHITSIEDTKRRSVSMDNASSDSMFATAFANASETSIVNNTFTSLSLQDDQSISTYQAAKSVELTCGGEAYSSYSSAFLPALEKENLTKYTNGAMTAYNSSKVEIDWYAIQYISNPSNGVNLYRYNMNGTQIGEQISEKRNSLTKPGSVFLKQDYYNTGMSTDEGSGSGTDKKNYEFKYRLYILQSGLSKGEEVKITGSEFTTEAAAIADLENLVASVTSNNMLRLYNKYGVTLSQGGICISMNVGKPNYRTYNSKRGPIMPDNSPRLTEKIRCLLRIGNKYWNGIQWTTNQSKFDIEVNDEGTGFVELKNTKTLAQEYVCNGCSIPITELLSGAVEFVMYGSYSGWVESQYDEESGRTTYWAMASMTPWFMVEDFKIEYCEGFDSMTLEEAETDKTWRKNIAEGDNEVSISCKMNTDVGIADGKATLYYNGNKVGSSNAIGRTGKLEEITFNRAVDAYSAPHTLYTLNVNNNSMMHYFAGFTFGELVTKFYSIKEHNLADAKLTCQFFK